MKTQECVLPVQCVGCGTTFDLWYDLQTGGGRADDIEGITVEGYGDEQHLCWGCRKKGEESGRGVGIIEGDNAEDDLVLTWE
jgi:hypothetical protein